MLHYSDCGIYNEPAYPATECDCGVNPINNIYRHFKYTKLGRFVRGVK